MHTTALFNFAPLANVGLMGLVIAMGPISWVWMQSSAPKLDQESISVEEGLSNKKLRQNRRLLLLSQITLFLTFDLLVFGAYTRLTDSGLGCPDWPGCYGFTSPNGASLMIDGAQQLMPTGPVTHFKAWVEMIHRYLATAVGVLILTMCLYAWVNKLTTRLKFASLFLLIWVCTQGAFGAFTVTMKLFPAIVTLHLLGAVVLLLMLTYFVYLQGSLVKGSVASMSVRRDRAGLNLQNVELNLSRSSATDPNLKGLSKTELEHIEHISSLLTYLLPLSPPSPLKHNPYLPLVLGVSIGIVLLQTLLGGWVSTNYAVTACSSFPMCQNSWWPHMNFTDGFELWRPLGMTGAGEILNFEALTAIHYTHRLFAYVVILGLVGVGAMLSREERFKKLGYLVWSLIALQAITGISNAVFQWPLLSAVMHTGGAACLVVVLSIGFLMSRERASEIACACQTPPNVLNVDAQQPKVFS
jgi:cytochrome c oxidase assembly protein subunit 15